MVSAIRFGFRVSLKVFASAFALVRGPLALVVFILIPVLVLGLVKNWLHLISKQSLCVEGCVMKFEFWGLRHVLIHFVNQSVSLHQGVNGNCSQSMVSWKKCQVHRCAHTVHGVMNKKMGITFGHSLFLKSIMNLPQVVYCSVREPLDLGVLS